MRTTHAGRDTTFGRVVQMVEQAETSRADVQRVADRFSAWYLPVVAGVAALTFLLRRDPLATAAVLVVACSCSFALATPIAMLASIGAAAGRGLLIKGGKYLETLARADVLLIDKTGTLTLGRPQLTDVVPFDGTSPDELLRWAASAERYSEHPLAQAVRAAAAAKGLTLLEPVGFEALPGLGVRCSLDGCPVSIGSERMVGAVDGRPAPDVADGQRQDAAVRGARRQVGRRAGRSRHPAPRGAGGAGAGACPGHPADRAADRRQRADGGSLGRARSAFPTAPSCCPRTRSPSCAATRSRGTGW